MKRLLRISSLLLAISISTISFAQKYSFGEKGEHRGYELVRSSKGNIQLKYKTKDFELIDVVTDGANMKQLTYGMMQLPGDPGAPDLPMDGQYVVIPNGATPRLSVNRGERVVYENVLIAPASEIPFDTEADIPPVRGSQYQKNEFYPADPFQIKTTEVRGMTLAHIDVAPFQYNPVTKQLVVYKDFDIKIDCEGGKGFYAEDRFRSKYWDNILSDRIINYKDLPKKNYDNAKRSENGCEYLIVVPNVESFKSWADSIRVFRNAQGIQTKVVTMEEVGPNTIDNIDEYFEDVYNTWDPVPSAVLLMADYGNDDHTITSQEYSHPNEGTYITDNHFADVTGNNLPDFVFARMAGETSNHFKIMVDKFRNYETTPPTDADFYNHPITALGWQTERWFQLCSEIVGGYMKNVKGKEPVRINAVYDGNPQYDDWSTAPRTSTIMNVFGPDGLGYIPETPAELGDWTGGSAQDVINAINDGAFMLQHRDHGFESGWGEPAFYSSHISQLNNADKLLHVFSVNCLTGRFNDNTDCFAEKFIRKANGGALSITAASQVSYSFVNDALVWGMYDNMFPDFLPDHNQTDIEKRDFRPAFGVASGKYFLSESNWAYNSGSKTITYRLFHHHGDAFGTVYSEVPQDLTVVVPDQISIQDNSIKITADEGALIGLSVGGDYITHTYGTGSEQTINIPTQSAGAIVKVVVTKQNYFRYEKDVEVYANNLSWVRYKTHTLDDTEGNSNGIVENNETISFHLELKNHGDIESQNVTATLSSSNENIEIIKGSESFGTLGAFNNINKDGAFKFKVIDGITDQEEVSLTLTITDGDQSYEEEIKFVVSAPVLAFDSYTIEEVEGNNDGFIDAGEKLNLTFEVTNTGNNNAIAGTATVANIEDVITFDATTINTEIVETGKKTEGVFTFVVNDAVTNNTDVSIPLNYASGAYTLDKTINIKTGKLTETFESGNFEYVMWDFLDDQAWVIDTENAYEGTFSAKSGIIEDDQKSTMIVNINVPSSSTISFYVKTSTEKNYDILRFYIDTKRKGNWSGDKDWELFTCEIEEGEHTLKWEYKKDGESGSGQDCVWIDNINLPCTDDLQFFAGYEGEINKTDANPSYTTAPQTNGFSTVSWTTNGDGTFADASAFETVYTAGTNDLNGEEIILTMTSSLEGKDYESSVKLKVIDPVSVEENVVRLDAIRPNPANDFVVVEHKNLKGNCMVKIIDNVGRTVYQKMNDINQKINTSSLSEGVYFMHIEKDGIVYSEKLVIKH